MRVLYDISLLGSNHRDPSVRTGIFRVTERVAEGLLASGECELTFCATVASQALHEASEYLRTNPALAGVPLPGPRAGVRPVRALSRCVADINRRDRVGIPAKVLRRAALQAIRAAEATYRRVAPRMLPPAEVFHSPFFALPRPLGRSAGPARFLTIHDLIATRFPDLFVPSHARYMEQVYRSVGPEDWVLAVSENTRADFCEHRGVDPARVFVTPWAADPTLFHPCEDGDRQAVVRRRYGIPEEVPYILSLNTLEPRKNMDHAVRAFARLVEQERLTDLHFVLVGAHGWKFEKIFEALREVGAPRAQIILTGYVADEDLAPLYSDALAFVYPSLYEGFGLPPLEAMQCGTPVITSNTSSLPEVVGDAGILLDPADAEGLSQSLLALYRDPSLRERMRAASLARARLFSWRRCVEQTLAAYRMALAS